MVDGEILVGRVRPSAARVVNKEREDEDGGEVAAMQAAAVDACLLVTAARDGERHVRGRCSLSLFSERQEVYKLVNSSSSKFGHLHKNSFAPMQQKHTFIMRAKTKQNLRLAAHSGTINKISGSQHIQHIAVLSKAHARPEFRALQLRPSLMFNRALQSHVLH
jgi:hypothetical protein